LTLADDIARWTRHEGRFEKIFEERSGDRFVERWPAAKSMPILLSFDPFDTQTRVLLVTGNDVASLAGQRGGRSHVGPR
jgi:hypothetical protein